MASSMVPLTRPHLTGHELEHIARALEGGSLSGNGPYGQRCAQWLSERMGGARVLIVPSCTVALELAALLFGVGPGDEVIMPSFAFPSLASAFALRGATPVFVDVREDTLCLDERLVEEAVTERTRAICPLHYAGVACEMDALGQTARRHGLRVLEDAAHSLLGTRCGRPLGSIGDLGALSFHATKNIQAGEAGALVIGDEGLAARAEVLQEKGTNRGDFLRGHAARYQWVDIGTSALLGELTAAALWAQLEAAEQITAERRRQWAAYHEALAPLEAEGLLRRPVVLPGSEHDGHIYWVLAPGAAARERLIADLAAAGIGSAFHYVPLHSAPAGVRHGRVAGPLEVTERASATLLRLPVWPGLPDDVPERVAEVAARSLRAG